MRNEKRLTNFNYEDFDMPIEWLFLGAAIIGIVAGLLIRDWMVNLTPAKKRVSVMKKLRRIDSEMWAVCEREFKDRNKGK